MNSSPPPPTPPPLPPLRENVILHAIRAWSMCGQWWGEGSLHLSPRRVGTVCIFSWAPVLLAQDRGDLGYTPMVLKACCMCSCHFWCVFTLFSPPVVYINSVAALIPNDYSHKQPVSLWSPLEKDTDGTCDSPALTPHAHCHTQYHSKYL